MIYRMQLWFPRNRSFLSVVIAHRVIPCDVSSLKIEDVVVGPWSSDDQR